MNELQTAVLEGIILAFKIVFYGLMGGALAMFIGLLMRFYIGLFIAGYNIL